MVVDEDGAGGESDGVGLLCSPGRMVAYASLFSVPTYSTAVVSPPASASSQSAASLFCPSPLPLLSAVAAGSLAVNAAVKTSSSSFSPMHPSVGSRAPCELQSDSDAFLKPNLVYG